MEEVVIIQFPVYLSNGYLHHAAGERCEKYSLQGLLSLITEALSCGMSLLFSTGAA